MGNILSRLIPKKKKKEKISPWEKDEQEEEKEFVDVVADAIQRVYDFFTAINIAPKNKLHLHWLPRFNRAVATIMMFLTGIFILFLYPNPVVVLFAVYEYLIIGYLWKTRERV